MSNEMRCDVCEKVIDKNFMHEEIQTAPFFIGSGSRLGVVVHKISNSPHDNGAQEICRDCMILAIKQSAEELI